MNRLAHQRSKQKFKDRITERKIRHTLKTYINHESFRDPICAETVCMTDHVTLRDYGYTVFGEHFSTEFIPPVDKGYILADTRARGIFQ